MYADRAISNAQLNTERQLDNFGLAFAVYAEDGRALSLQGATANVFQARKLALDIHEAGERPYVRNSMHFERHWFLDLPEDIARFARRVHEEVHA